MTEIEHSGNELIIDGESIELPETVDTYVEFDDLAVVLLDTLGKSSYPRNVWAFDTDGDLEWKVEPVEPTAGRDNPYTSVGIEGGDLWAWNWDGHRYRIDASSGEILDRVFTK